MGEPHSLVQQARDRAPPVYFWIEKEGPFGQKACLAIEHFKLKNAVRADGVFRSARPATTKFVMVGAPVPDLIACIDLALSGDQESLT